MQLIKKFKTKSNMKTLTRNELYAIDMHSATYNKFHTKPNEQCLN